MVLCKPCIFCVQMIVYLYVRRKIQRLRVSGPTVIKLEKIQKTVYILLYTFYVKKILLNAQHVRRSTLLDIDCIDLGLIRPRCYTVPEMKTLFDIVSVDRILSFVKEGNLFDRMYV